MAVQAYLTNYASSVGVKSEPGSNASVLTAFRGYIAVLAADDDTSTYLIAKSVPASFKPVRVTVQTTAITSGTDWDLGFYDSVTGLEADKDVLMDGQTLASASRTLDGLQTVSVANLGGLKTVYELLNLTATTCKPQYDLVLTANTVGSAAGDVSVIVEGFTV